MIKKHKAKKLMRAAYRFLLYASLCEKKIFFCSLL